MYRRFCFHLRRLRDRHRILCVLTVIAFVSSSMGLPLKPAGAPTSGCRCGDCSSGEGCGCCRSKSTSCCAGEKQASCCSKVPKKPACCSPVAPSDCCSKPSTRSCCSKPENSSPPVKSCCSGGSGSPSTPQPAGWNACTCGATIVFDMLINAEPRILPAVIKTQPADENGQALVLSDPPPLQHALLPETPPPERIAI